jgi:TubC N-terminal docking domain
MTGTPSKLADLLTDCDARGIQLMLAEDGGLTIDAPRDALTPHLLDKLKARKTELIAVLVSEQAEMTDDVAVIGPDGWPIDSIDPNELSPCPTCGRYEFWQSGAGNWRCEHCEPPTTALRLLELADRLRQRSDVNPTRVGATATLSTSACQCGSTTWRDVPIHNGQSVRRDCGRCGRFVNFPIWHGTNTGHNDQHRLG